MMRRRYLPFIVLLIVLITLMTSLFIQGVIGVQTSSRAMAQKAVPSPHILYVWKSITPPQQPFFSFTVDCPAGMTAIGGGVETATVDDSTWIHGSYPTGPGISGASGSATTATGWTTVIQNNNSHNSITGYAVCV